MCWCRSLTRDHSWSQLHLRACARRSRRRRVCYQDDPGRLRADARSLRSQDYRRHPWEGGGGHDQGHGLGTVCTLLVVQASQASTPETWGGGLRLATDRKTEIELMYSHWPRSDCVSQHANIASRCTFGILGDAGRSSVSDRKLEP